MKTFNDLLVTPSTFGGEGAGSDPNVFALLYRNVFGAKIKLVSGYPGTNEIQLATERGEVDGLCGLSWSTLKGRYPHWLKERKANILVQAGIKKEAGAAQRPGCDRSRQGAGAASNPQSDPHRPGDGASVRGAARHPGRPQGGLDRGLRPHRARMRTFSPRRSGSTSTSTRSPPPGSTPCWRRPTPRPRTSSPGPPRRCRISAAGR